ncbi:MAG: ECF-type sigma factor [Verrucomicrobiota bacterium]
MAYVASGMSEVTRILECVRSGDAKAAEELLPAVYHELRQLAAAKLAREPAGHTFQPTALVHEAWLRLGGDQQPVWQNRAHFFGAAGEAMRRILIDRARKRQVRQSSGLVKPEPFEEAQLDLQVPETELLALDEVLDSLAAVDAEAARLVKLRYFVGMSMGEVSEAMTISRRQAERLWTFAKAWLRDAIRRER